MYRNGQITRLEQATIHRRLLELSVAIVLNRAVTRIDQKCITTECMFSGQEDDQKADAVVMVTARVGNCSLWQELASRETNGLVKV